ncbi:MAG: energy transducer TonB [Candidatus Eisenbacteria bacterium]|uniref:Energy transducer TonB n=1 Tax=Eiseniibacteriota bacterium TaxID=2212470 RepID=A0A538T9Y4_UNCEI|nr:MAG: energy transducer TonB [Candidatus Eisenbacteria bacterium]
MTSTTAATTLDFRDTSERVPIGAADLKANAQRLLKKALIISAAIHLSLVGLYVLATIWKPRDDTEYTGRVIRLQTLPPPPSLSNAPPPPVIPNQPIVKPTIGTPVPVPDAQAPEQTIMTQQEIAALTAPVGVGGSGKDSLVITTEELPSEGEFVYYEDPPVPVTQVQPAYPEFAREAQIQGKVVLHVLVDKNGRVKNVKVIRGVTGLNEAAVDAIKKWVFKPALSNNKPVAVWVEVPMDFHF